eukprot:gene13532-19402_t
MDIRTCGRLHPTVNRPRNIVTQAFGIEGSPFAQPVVQDDLNKLIASQTRGDSLTDCTLLSTVHGRDRRALRDIRKKDLQAAVKHGHRVRSRGPGGVRRWKYTFAEIVYVTDDTSREEVTSWVLPVEISEVPTTRGDIGVHEESARKLRMFPHLCTSHIVLVVDQSGSMRTCDVADHKTRSDAVFGTIALDLIGRQIDHADTALTDAVTLIEMRDYATTMFEREPLTNVLFNKMLRRRNDSTPSSHGNYIPALERAACVLSKDAGNKQCALLLLFLSDGKPSDQRRGDRARIKRAVQHLAEPFGGQLTVGMIGFGGSQPDFSVIESMAAATNAAGANGTFSNYSHGDSSILSTTISSLSSKLSATRTRITALTRIAGSRQGLKQRPVGKAPAPHIARLASRTSDHFPEDEWRLCGPDRVKNWQWQGRSKGMVHIPMESPSLGVAVKICETGRGAERVVHELHHTVKDASSGKLMPIGRALVAKESAYTEDDYLKRDYHYCFCKTQQQAGRFARKFNEWVAMACAQQKWPVPAIITFLAPTIYVCKFSNGPTTTALLVEKMLDQCELDDVEELQDSRTEQQSLPHQSSGGKRQPRQQARAADPGPSKHWQQATAARQHYHGCGFPTGGYKPARIAFSHYTYHYSQRKSLVCDLQGTLDTSVIPALFELTDPVIHYESNHERQRVYGRTDRGRRGMDAFFRSHKCNALCRLLWLPDSSHRSG